jgi:Tfp pilus assembly protein PilF
MEEALLEAKEAVKCDPSAVSAIRHLAHVMRLCGENERAEELLPQGL